MIKDIFNALADPIDKSFYCIKCCEQQLHSFIDDGRTMICQGCKIPSYLSKYSGPSVEDLRSIEYCGIKLAGILEIHCSYKSASRYGERFHTKLFDQSDLVFYRGSVYALPYENDYKLQVHINLEQDTLELKDFSIIKEMLENAKILS